MKTRLRSDGTDFYKQQAIDLNNNNLLEWKANASIQPPNRSVASHEQQQQQQQQRQDNRASTTAQRIIVDSPQRAIVGNKQTDKQKTHRFSYLLRIEIMRPEVNRLGRMDQAPAPN
jgi:hypothetical protein